MYIYSIKQNDEIFNERLARHLVRIVKVELHILYRHYSKNSSSSRKNWEFRPGISNFFAFYAKLK